MYMWVLGCSLATWSYCGQRKWLDLGRLGRGTPEQGKEKPGPFLHQADLKWRKFS